MNELEFLLELREYIEKVEVAIEGEFNYGRNLDKIISDGDMPDIYDEVLRRINNTLG